MGQIIVPSDKKTKGPWLLDSKSLEDLSDTLLSIENKLEEAYNILVDKTAEANFEEYEKWEKGIDIEKAKLKVKNSYAFERSVKYVLIHTRQGKKIKDDNLLSLLKGEQLNEFNPTELYITIVKGPCEFTLEVSKLIDGQLETRIKVQDDGIFNDINYEINKWIDKYKPNLVMQKWSSWFPWGAVVFFLGLLIASSFFSKDRADIYAVKLSQESNLLLKEGLSEQEIPKAIEIILQKESGYVPETFNPDITAKNNFINRILFFTSIVLVILLLKPQTVIGLGKNKWKVSFYRT